jgi:hypothetical protein
MVDKVARATLREKLAELIDGKIAADAFQNASKPLAASTDLGVSEIIHFATYCETTNAEQKAILQRCLHFLGSDLEYRWPIGSTRRAGLGWFVLIAIFVVMAPGCLAGALFASIGVMTIVRNSYAGLQLFALASMCLLPSAIAGWVGRRYSRQKHQQDEAVYWSHGEKAAWPFLTTAEQVAIATKATT